MAARLEVYSVAGGTTIESWDPAVLDTAGADRSSLPDLEGYVSASDADEQALFDVLGAVADLTAVDARAHGAGHIGSSQVGDLTAKLRTLAAREAGLPASWLSSLAAAAGKVEHRGADLAWRMRYDTGGSGDAGPEEFPTAWS